MTSLPPLPADLERLPRSGIRLVMDRAWELGEPITHLEVGEPRFATPEHIVEAFCHAARSGETKYTPNAGIAPLRAACAHKLATVNDIHVDADQVLVTVGAMQGLMCAVIGLTGHGDEILAPNPGWPNYQLLIALAGARAVRYDLLPERGYLAIARARGIWVLSDECYDQIVFDQQMISPAARPLGAQQTITVHSFSKTYAMTGFRLGYLSAPRRVTALLTKLQESMVACVNTPTQYAGLAALEGPPSCVTDMVREYRARRDLAVGRARALGLDPRDPAGAFYLWLELPAIADSQSFAEQLLTQHRVAVAPGSTFGELGRPAIRISLAAERDAIEAGFDAIGRVIGGQPR